MNVPRCRWAEGTHAHCNSAWFVGPLSGLCERHERQVMVYTAESVSRDCREGWLEWHKYRRRMLAAGVPLDRWAYPTALEFYGPGAFRSHQLLSALRGLSELPEHVTDELCGIPRD